MKHWTKQRGSPHHKGLVVPAVLLERGLHVEVAVHEQRLLVGVAAQAPHQHRRQRDLGAARQLLIRLVER